MQGACSAHTAAWCTRPNGAQSAWHSYLVPAVCILGIWGCQNAHAAHLCNLGVHVWCMAAVVCMVSTLAEQ